MSVALQVTPVIWWEAHQDQLQEWNIVKIVLLYQFSPLNELLRNIPIYNGRTSPQDRVMNCCSCGGMMAWQLKCGHIYLFILWEIFHKLGICRRS